MNRKNYSKKASKPEAMESKTSNPSPMLLGQLSDSSRVISGVNDVLASPSVYDYIYANTHYALAISDVVDTVADLIDGSLEDVINAFSASKGYTSSVTPSIIRGHLEQVVKAVAALFVLKRSQDAKELTDFKGNTIYELFTNATTDGQNFVTGGGGVSGPDMSSLIVNVTPTGVGAISNAAWGTTYLSQLSKLVIPYKLFKFIETLFSGVYKNDTVGVLDAYITFWPDDVVTLSGLTTPETVFANAITSIDSNLNTYSDLRSIIGVLGIDAQPVMNYDWTRDVKGQSLLVYRDPLMDTFLKNHYAAYAAFDEFDVPQTIQDSVELPFVMGSIEYIEDSFSVTQDMLPYLGLFRDIGGNDGLCLLHTAFAQVNGNKVYYPALPSGQVRFGGSVTALSATGESRVTNLTRAMLFGDLVLPKLSQMLLYYDVANNDADHFTIVIDSGVAFSGQNSMLFKEDDHTISNQMYITELIFGTDYRANLNAIARSISANIHIG